MNLIWILSEYETLAVTRGATVLSFVRRFASTSSLQLLCRLRTSPLKDLVAYKHTLLEMELSELIFDYVNPSLRTLFI